MSKDRFHFEIPGENIRNEKYEKRGFSPKVPRLSHLEHGKKLQLQSQEYLQTELKKKDVKYTDDFFLQIETPNEISIKSQKLKIEYLGFKLLSFSRHNKSIGTATIEKEKFEEFEERLNIYTNSPDNKGKTYFAPIEKISSIPPESKIKENIDFESEDIIEIVINLFNVIKLKELLAVSNSISEELRKYSENVEQRSFTNGVTSIYCRIPAKHIA